MHIYMASPPLCFISILRKQIRREKQKGCKQKKIRKKIQQILEVRLERERERVKSGSGGGS
jgi:hypothetical protein